MRIFPCLPAAALVALILIPATARAHFIWAIIDQGQARFALLESPSEKPDARFGTYVDGLETPLALGAVTDGARSGAVPKGQTAVSAQTTVGVKNREGVDYLLLYHAKGTVSLQSAGKASTAAFEIVATREGDALVASVRQDGWPVPATEVTLHVPGSDRQTTATTDLSGSVRFPFPVIQGFGFVGLRAKVVEGKAGTAQGKPYTQVHHWTTLTFPLGERTAPTVPSDSLSLTRFLRKQFEVNHDIVGHAAFNDTLFHGTLTRQQALIHFQQRALVHSEVHRILIGADPALPIPYGPGQKEVLTYLFTDLIAMGSGWPTEAQARPLTAAFLQEIRESEKRGPYFALGVQHVYYGGITNGGRMIGQKIAACLGFSPGYYAKSAGYREYLAQVDTLVGAEVRAEMLRGGQAAYRYIIASSNEDIFKTSATP
jgi:hypothetical protein